MINVLNFDNINEAKATMTNCLQKDNWENYFCKNDHKEVVNFYKTENEVKEIAELYSFGGFISAEKCKEILYGMLRANLDQIADWLVKNQKILDLYVTFDEPIGYIYNNNKQNTSNTVFLRLRRDIKNVTEFNFFVSTFVPV